IPILVELITRLVIMLRVVLAELGVGGTFGLSDDLRPERDFECRHTDACEHKVIRTIEASLFGTRIGSDLEIESSSRLHHHRICAGSLRAGDDDVFRPRRRMKRIVVYVDRDLVWGN